MMSTLLWLQSERLLQPVTAVTAHPVKAVVQTGERPDFERTTSSGAPARPGPITSGMPKPRLDFRIPSGSFLDAGGLVNDTQVRQRRLTCMRGRLPWSLFDIFDSFCGMPKPCLKFWCSCWRPAQTHALRYMPAYLAPCLLCRPDRHTGRT